MPGLSGGGRQERGRGTQQGGRRICHYPVEVPRRAIPNVFEPPGPAQDRLEGLDVPRGTRSRPGQPFDRHRDPQAETEAGEAARLQELCRVPVCRSHAQDPRKGHRSPGKCLGKGQGCGRHRAASTGGLRSGEGRPRLGRKRHSRTRHPGLGLAVLRRAGPNRPLRFRREPPQTLPQPGERHRGGHGGVQQAIWVEIHPPGRHQDLPRIRQGLRGPKRARERQAGGDFPPRQLRPKVQVGRCMDVGVPKPDQKPLRGDGEGIPGNSHCDEQQQLCQG
mmetsp:Transcript_24670/g.68110  ORF Transcript_24670/g.68110 Transcript_24670/m.68110 type:complete len:277 (+) Transcript_24670:943-1773(+)